MIEKLYQHFITNPIVSTDTRKIAEDSLFFALNGDNFNGNRFAAEALEKGARMVVVDEKVDLPADKVFPVDDVLTSLQHLARHHRDQFDIPVIGITGSNGKTSNRELIDVALSVKFNALATEGNFNNEIGVPLTLLRLRKGHEIAIIEMGARRIGDIEELCTIANPNHTMITNIGLAHVETFGSPENILRGKSEIYQHIREHGGTPFFNTLQPELENMVKRFPDAYTYPKAGNNLEVSFLGADPFVKFEIKDQVYTTNLLGKHHFNTVATALAFADFFGIELAEAATAIAAYKSANNRLQIYDGSRNEVILDAYNANPNSMMAALEILHKSSSDKKLAVLGDMLELGDISVSEHQKIGTFLKAHPEIEGILIGREMAAAGQGDNYMSFSSKEEAVAYIQKKLYSGYQVLIKGSRGMQMETLLNLF